MDQKRIGGFIASLRKENNLTQAELGEILGVSNRTVSKWETGDGMPDVSILQALAKTLGVSVDELLSAEKKDIAQLKVTEVESKSATENWFLITNIIALFLGFFGAILGFVTLAYNIWAFDVLFFNHWEIMFVALSLVTDMASILFFAVGVVKLKLTYNKDEIVRIAGKKGLMLAAINSVLPVMFVLRIIDVSRYGYYTLYFAIVIVVFWFVAFFLVRRRMNESNK